MLCFFLSLIQRKLPQGCPKLMGRGGGGQVHFWAMSTSERIFSQDYFPRQCKKIFYKINSFKTKIPMNIYYFDGHLVGLRGWIKSHILSIQVTVVLNGGLTPTVRYSKCFKRYLHLQPKSPWIWLWVCQLTGYYVHAWGLEALLMHKLQYNLNYC